ncbi:MAG TPA: phospholipase A, partial [Polyangia bacterium]
MSGTGVAALLAASSVLASSGPPIGRIEIEQRPVPAPVPVDAGAGSADAGASDGGGVGPARDAAPPPEPVLRSPPPGASPPPPPAPEPAPAPSPAQAPVNQPRMPTIQRPDQPIETTAVPGEVTPQTPDAGKVEGGLEYVRGLRYILSGHRENYFISGLTSAQHVVKFQYSAKFDLWPNATRHSAYFGFTQKSLWRLWDFDNSSPFDESNYAPEIFYGYYAKIGDIIPQPGTVDWFVEYARAGLEHESNGAEGVRSRSWNRIYATVQGGA